MPLSNPLNRCYGIVDGLKCTYGTALVVEKQIGPADVRSVGQMR